MMHKNWIKYGAVTLGFVFLIAYVEAVADDFSPNDDSGNYVFVNCESFDGSGMVKADDGFAVKSVSDDLPVDHFHYLGCGRHAHASLASHFTSSTKTAPLHLALRL